MAGDSVYAPSNPYRPFCSERCKQIDLGAWASESFAIAEPADGAETPMADNATDPLRREPTRH